MQTVILSNPQTTEWVVIYETSTGSVSATVPAGRELTVCADSVMYSASGSFECVDSSVVVRDVGGIPAPSVATDAAIKMSAWWICGVIAACHFMNVMRPKFSKK